MEWDEVLRKWDEIEYIDGAQWMSSDLGLGGVTDLEEWARENKEVWGNCRGYQMFDKAQAYGDGEGTRAESLRDVYEHWVRVRGRLAERMTAMGQR